jgi:F-type H+-transporting ATPase subunit b
MPQLEQIDTFISQIFWFFLTFAVIYFFLSRVATVKIADILQKRQNIIASDIDTAGSLKEQLVEIEKSLSSKVLESKSRAMQVVSQANKEAEDFYNKQLIEAENDIKKNALTSEKDIIFAKEKAMKEIHSDATIFVEEILKKLAGVKVAKSNIEKVISEKK